MWDSAAAEDYPSVANDPVSGAPLFAQQFYVGMTTGPSGPPTFEYGSLADAGLPAVFVISETKQGNALPGSNFQGDGTITILVPKSAVGNPQPGDLLGAVNGRTFTGDTAETVTLERSTLLIDHTFVKAQRDNGSPAATYTVLGNSACEGGVIPLSAVSRKTHGSISPPFDIDLPLSGNVGIECRIGQGTSSNDHQVVVTFPVPVTVSNVTVSSGTGSVSTFLVSGNQVFINLTGVANAQTIRITLVGVNDGTNTADVSVPMGMLLGDVNANKVVSNGDVSAIKAQVGQTVALSNFRDDVNANGTLSNGDVSVTQAQVGQTLP